VECARSWLVRTGSERLPSSVLSNEFGSLGQIQTVVRIVELHLVLRIVATTSLFPCVDYRWWPVVEGASRHSWQQISINVLIKGCGIKRHPEEDAIMWVWDWRVSKVLEVLIVIIMYLVMYILF